MSGKYKLAKALVKTQVIKQDVQEEIPAVLGVTKGGKKLVENPGRPGYYYARIHGNLSELVQAYNDQVSPVYGLHVLLIRDKVDKGRFRIKGRDLGKYQNWGATSYLPKHGAQHSFNPDTPGGDIVWVWGKQFMPLMGVPSGSAGGPNVVIYGSPFQVNGDWAFAGDTGTVDILPYMKPTGAWARMVLAFIDSNGNPQVTGSSLYFDPSLTGTSDIVPYVPKIDTSTNAPVIAIRLVSGTSIINWDNIYDFRTHYSMNNSVGHTIQDDGVSLTQRSYLNFQGAGFVVYDSAGKTNVSGTAALPALVANRILYTDDLGVISTNNYFSYDHDTDIDNLIIGGLGSIANELNFNISSITDYGGGSQNVALGLFGYDTSAEIDFHGANNSEASPQYSTNGNTIGSWYFNSYATGTAYCGFYGIASLDILAYGDQVNNLGSEFLFKNGISGSTVAPQESFRLRYDTAWFRKDVITNANGAYYLGDPRVTGSWRSLLANNRIEFQENVAGNWTTLGWSNTGSSGGAGGHIIQDNGVDQTARTNLNFIGFVVTDDAGNDATKIELLTGDYAETIGSETGTVFSISHNLGTQDILVELWNVAGATPYLATDEASLIEIGDVNTIFVTFASPPGLNSYRVVVLRSGSGITTNSQALFTVEGVLTVGNKALLLPNVLGRNVDISKVFLAVPTGSMPTDASIIADIYLNGVTIFTDPDNRPQILPGTNTGYTTTIDVPTWTNNSFLTLGIAQVGSGTAGSNLTAVIVYS